MKRVRIGTYDSNGKFVGTKSTPADKARLAAMLAAQTPPGTKGTDRTFNQDRHDPIPGTPDWLAKRMLDQAHAAGVVTTGKTYKGFLADWRGHCDPEAWVSSVSEAKSVAVKRNKNLVGCIENKAIEMPPAPDIRLAEDIVQRKMKEYAKAEHKLAKKPRELREMVIEKHGAKA